MFNFLPSTDNFFKYLLTMGIILVAFTILYPIQKQKELDLSLLSLDKDTAILNMQVKNLMLENSILNKEFEQIQDSVDKLKILVQSSTGNEKDSIEKIRMNLKNQFESKNEKIATKADQLTLKVLDIHNANAKIQILKKYLSWMNGTRIFSMSMGLGLIFFGIRYWSSSVLIDERKKGNEYEPKYKTVYVRNMDYCQNFLKPLPTKIIFFIIFSFIIIYILNLLFNFY